VSSLGPRMVDLAFLQHHRFPHYSSCLTKFFMKLAVWAIGSRIFQDRRNGPSNFQNWLVLECRWSQNDESGNPLAIPQCNEILEFKSRNVLPKIVTIGPFNERTEAGELQIWAQWWFGSASDRRYETRMRTDKQTFTRRCTTLWARHWWHTSSMTGSGGFTPGTPVSTHKREMK